ncbi:MULTISPECIES: DUF2267 domain-containing protein [unclassified Streptomyces]|uniref:DUF2267 domain-containing protein n=1 Tax=unclassified Streptomyces TaxID=2593676 RepID=UPI000A619445|nr:MULTISPECIES: DUF2267 domain-containing protein [unclassified Streptomyces]AZM59108.1 DUF2267 domain-containing protein [Streptomyces sp. WAC 01438]RSM96782.1 DUF2267 domain-containing protein [Streptomyces sp. WAC 01420]
MVDTGFSSFDTMVDKANRLLRDIEEAFGWPKERRRQSYAALRAVLHPLRDRLPVDTAVQFGAQLPTIIRGIYYDGWKPAEVPVKMHNDEFLARVRQEFPYAVVGGTERLVRTTLHTLALHVSTGEWEHLKSRVPDSFGALMPDVEKEEELVTDQGAATRTSE